MKRRASSLFDQILPLWPPAILACTCLAVVFVLRGSRAAAVLVNRRTHVPTIQSRNNFCPQSKHNVFACWSYGASHTVATVV